MVGNIYTAARNFRLHIRRRFPKPINYIVWNCTVKTYDWSRNEAFAKLSDTEYISKNRTCSARSDGRMRMR